jgi:hypothetical protein
VDLSSSSDDPRAPVVRALLSRIAFDSVAPGEPRPDRYVYRFRVGDTDVTVHEPFLTPELSELARVVLGE